MADGVTLDPGTGGAVINTDDIAGVHTQIVKPGFGALDSLTLAASGAGAVSAGVQRVTLASDDPGVAHLATIAGDTTDIEAAIEILDNTVVVLGTDTYTEATSSGLVIGAVRRDADTTLVNTTNEYGPLQMDANGRLKVEAFSGEALPVTLTSTTITGTVAVTQSGTWDEVGINDSGNSITVDWAGTAPPIGAGVEATALRVTVATDSTGVLSVDDNGGALTVDNGGTFAVQVDGAALTALQLIDDIVYTDDTSTHATGTSKGALIMAAATPTDGSVNANDIGAVGMTTDRKLHVAVMDALPAGTNGIGKLTANSGVDIGDVDVTSISAGTNNIGNVGLIGRDSGGMTIFRSIDLDESEEEIKATAGQIFSISAFNRTAAPLYLKFYNLTAANTTVGTSTPVLTFVVPANADSDGAGFIWNNTIGFAFSTAISAAVTTGVADNDTGAPGANDCIVNVGYV